MERAELEELFAFADVDHSGYIEKEEVYRILPNIDDDALQKLIEQLDTDGDGRISLEELQNGIMSIVNCEAQPKAKRKVSRTLSRQGFRSRSLSDLQLRGANYERSISQMSETSDENYHEGLGRKSSTISLFTSLESHNEAFQVYVALQEDAQLLQKFEKFIEETVRRIKDQSKEKESLERVLTEEKKTHQQRLQELEEEMDIMKDRIEQRTKTQMEQKFEEDRRTYEEEINTLRESLEKMKEMESEIKRRAKEEVSPLKNKLNDLEKALRQLRNEKTEAETNYLLAKSQLTAFRQNLAEHSEEREKDKELVLDYITEQVNLARQVNQLQETNKYLQDANIDLQTEVTTLRQKIAKNVGDRMQRNLRDEIGSDTTSLSGRMSPFELSKSMSNKGNLFEELEQASNASSLSDEHHMGTWSQARSVSDDDGGYSLHRHHAQHFSTKASRAEHSPASTEATDSHSPSSEYLNRLDLLPRSMPEVTQYTAYNGVAHPSTSLKGSPGGMTSVADLNSKLFTHKRNDSSVSRSSIQSINSPQRLYKIIFAGDAGTGKSSFIAKLVRGTFNPHMQATVGLDFHTKVCDVDDTKINLQLWDTAGQERFRCITSSYFRKADGVVLLYDCCSERSFASMRDWVHQVHSNSESESSMLICANKIDLRVERPAGNTVSSELGKKLANEYGALFFETSAKTGAGMEEAIVELSRQLKTREDIHIQQFGQTVNLTDAKQEKKKKGCC